MKRLDIITNGGYIESTLEQCEYEGLNKEQTALKVKKIIDEAIRLVSKNESLHLVSVSDRTIEDKAKELSQKLTDDEGEQFDIQENFRDGAKWMRAMIKLHSS